MNKYKPNIILRFLYNTIPGRILLKPFVSYEFSEMIGKILDSRYSKFIIPIFVKANKIDTSEYEQREYKSYNDFFKRKGKKNFRTIDKSPSAFISPCDGALTVHRISKDSIYNIKNSRYRVADLLCDGDMAEEYENGYILIFRLAVNNYHRYCFIDDGLYLEHCTAFGTYHTVQPIAFNSCNVFAENHRVYTSIDTENFGEIVQCEVGAMAVGKISNHQLKDPFVKKGQEKGYFEFGGSTIIILVKDNKIKIRKDIARNSINGYETSVKIGEKIAQKL